MDNSTFCPQNAERGSFINPSNIAYWDEALVSLAEVQNILSFPLSERFIHTGGYATYRHLTETYGGELGGFYRDISTVNLVCTTKEPVTPFVSSANYVRPHTFIDITSSDPYTAAFGLLSSPDSPQAVFHLMQQYGEVQIYDKVVKPFWHKQEARLSKFILEPPDTVVVKLSESSNFEILISSLLDTLVLKAEVVSALQSETKVFSHDLDLAVLFHLYVNNIKNYRGPAAGNINDFFNGIFHAFEYPRSVREVKKVSLAVRESLFRYLVFLELGINPSETEYFSSYHLPSAQSISEILSRVDRYLKIQFDF